MWTLDLSVSPTSGWDNFFVAQASAAAALAGLLFVAVSINLTRILSLPHLPGRAAETLIMLVVQLVVAMLGLVPRQGAVWLGAELVVLGAGAAALATWLQIRARHDPHRHVVARVVTSQLPATFFVLAGLSLLAGLPGGVYWIAPGAVAGFMGVSLNTWVLLIEIQR